MRWQAITPVQPQQPTLGGILEGLFALGIGCAVVYGGYKMLSERGIAVS